MGRLLFLAVALPLLVLGLPASDAQPVVVDDWLVLGPVPVPLGTWPDAKSILDYEFLDPVSAQPREGRRLEWGDGRDIAWRSGQPGPWNGQPAGVVWLAAYLETGRFLGGELEISSPFSVTVWLDGQAVAGSGAPWRGALKLESGKHLLLVKGALAAGAAGGDVRAQLRPEPGVAGAAIAVSHSPERRLAIDDVLCAAAVTGLQVSPDGNLVAVFLSQRPEPGSAERSWMDIMQCADGRRLFSTKNVGEGEVGHFCWLKDSRRFSFSRRERDLTSIYVCNLADFSERRLLAGIKDFAGCWWSRDNRLLIYARSLPEVSGERHYRFIPDVPHRALTPATRTELTLFVPASGARWPLSSREDNFETAAISPDGRAVILGKVVPDERQRPYEKHVWDIVDLRTFTRRRLLESFWIQSLSWAPDSRRLLLLGGASAFDGLGRNLPDGVEANDFDVQAYVYHVASGKAEAISRRFAPSIEEAVWLDDGQVYLRVTEAESVRLYRCDPRTGTFTRLETGVDSVAEVSWGRRGPAVFWGSGAARPHRLFRMGLGGGVSLLADFNRERLSAVRLGRAESWGFRSPRGRQIPGTLYYPPDFDPKRTWPCIVYYYGGTTPVTREFGGRYPKDWYAANGYLVWVPQPSGAVGFGQEVSAAHVNDWGELTSEEILAGVEELLRAHPFIDPRRLGAMGASYGGFLTQYLATRGERFAAFVSHAGISALSSYWGAGDWGTRYSGVASAASFPWNRKDLYVGHSPLFMAERISRPLLLLHGEEDNNVPPGESYQMYAALKLLGKEVALVTFPGQRHFILDYEKRVRWMKTIVAWFDRWLKEEPQAWFDLYPEDRRAEPPAAG